MPTVMRLSKYEIDQRSFDPRGPQNQFLWEESTPGFGVQMYPTGKKSYVVTGGIHGTRRTRRKALGPVDNFANVHDARNKANFYLMEMRNGRDPWEAKEARLGRFADKPLREAIDEYADDLRARQMREGTIRDYDVLLPRWLGELVKRFDDGRYLELEDWMERGVFDLKKTEIRQRHAAIGAHHPKTANQVMRCLRAVINHQIDLVEDEDADSIPVNIVSHAMRKRWYPERPRKRVLDSAEIVAFLDCLDDWEGNKLFPPYLRLQLYAGLRVGEVAKLRWDDVLGDRLVIQSEVTKNDREFHVPLTPRLIEEIDILRFHHEFHAPTKEALQWVFPSETSHNGRIASEQWPQKAVRDACTDIQRPWTNHDLRRTFATIAAELGAGGFVVDALTNHMTQGVNKAYVHVGFEKHREWLVRIGEHLDGLRNI